MLPPGHIAGGYLAGYAFLSFFNQSFSIEDERFFIFLSMASAFAPDFDMFFPFLKIKAFHSATQAANHRLLITHTPLFWIIAGAGIFLILGASTQSALIAFFLILGAVSHLVLDSIQYGIRWLYPFSKRLYGLCALGVELEIPREGFFLHWLHFLRAYARHFTLTLALEITVVAAALILAFRFPL